MMPRPPLSTLFPYTTLFRSELRSNARRRGAPAGRPPFRGFVRRRYRDRAWPSRRRSGELHVGNAPTKVALLLTQAVSARSEEHTSELQSPMYLVCRLLLEKK